MVIQKKLRSFSFLESMLAVFLLSVGLVGAISLLVSSTKTSMTSRDQVVASLLAQEGIEIARNIRDNNWAEGNQNVKGFDSFPNSGNTVDNCLAKYDGASPSVNDCTSSKTLNLIGNYYTTANGGTATKFSRKLMFEYLDASGVSTDRDSARYARVTSIVIWNGSTFPNPPVPPATWSASCNADNANNAANPTQCAYTQIELNNWGN